jgi:hypothetical protein
MPNNTTSVFDNDVLGEIETATRPEDVIDYTASLLINSDDYEGNNYYFFCAKIHPSFSLFIPVTPKHLVDDKIKYLISIKEGNNNESKNKLINEAMCVLMGCNNNFEKYKVKGGARLLEQYAKQGKKEYRDFANDVILYNIYMKVIFNKGLALWDINQIKEIGMFRE